MPRPTQTPGPRRALRRRSCGLGFPISRIVILFCLATGAHARGGRSASTRGSDQQERPVSKAVGTRASVPAMCRSGTALRLVLRHRAADSVGAWTASIGSASYRSPTTARQPAGPGVHVVTSSKPPAPSRWTRRTLSSLPGRMEVPWVPVHMDRARTRARYWTSSDRAAQCRRLHEEGCSTSLSRRRCGGGARSEVDRGGSSSWTLLRCKAPELVGRGCWMGLLACDVVRAQRWRKRPGAKQQMPHQLSARGGATGQIAGGGGFADAGRRRWLSREFVLEFVADDEVRAPTLTVDHSAGSDGPEPYPSGDGPTEERPRGFAQGTRFQARGSPRRV